jgi:hypothetical protein
VALSAAIATDVAVIWSDLLEIDLMNRLLDEGEVLTALSPEAFEDVEANDNRQLIVISLYTVALIAAVVFFIRWFHGAYANLPLLGQPAIRFNKAWAIVAWFVPIFNAWRPKQIANDIWRGSGTEAPSYGKEAWKDVPVPMLLQVWWAAWLVTNFLSNVVLRTYWDADSLESIKTAAQIEVVQSAIDVAAGALAIAVVLRLTSRQEARRAQLSAAPVPTDTMSAA